MLRPSLCQGSRSSAVGAARPHPIATRRAGARSVGAAPPPSCPSSPSAAPERRRRTRRRRSWRSRRPDAGRAPTWPTASWSVMTWLRRWPTPSPGRTRSSSLDAPRSSSPSTRCSTPQCCASRASTPRWPTVVATSTVRRCRCTRIVSGRLRSRGGRRSAPATSLAMASTAARRSTSSPTCALATPGRRSSGEDGSVLALVWATSRRTDDRAWALPIEALEPLITAAQSRVELPPVACAR